MFDEMEKMINVEARALPVILLLDTSGSMSGNKIETLNNAVSRMISTFSADSDSDVVIKTSIITFGGTSASVYKEYGNNNSELTVDLKAGGMTPLGSALRLAKEKIIEDKTVISSRDYRPTVILVSDGEPNDDWKNALDDFINNGRSSKCFRWALSICVEKNDEAYKMLEKFVSNKEYLFDSSSAADLYKFFQKVTVSTVARTKSVNPNVASSIEEEKACETIITYPDDDDENIPF